MALQQTGASQATPSTPRHRKAKRSRKLGVLTVALIFWLLVAAAVSGAVNSALSLYHSNYILPGVRVLGLDLGTKTASQAGEQLKSEWQAQQVVLDAGFTTWTLPFDAVGVQLDTGAMLRQMQQQGRSLPTTGAALATLRRLAAYSAGRWPPVGRLLTAIDPRLAVLEPIELQPIWFFDRDTAAETLNKLSREVEIAPQDAGIGIVDGRVEMTPSVTGRALDIGAAMAELEVRAPELALQTRSPDSVSSQGSGPAEGADRDAPRITLPIVTLTPVVTDVSALVEQVSPLLDNSITVDLWDPIRDERLTWTVTPQDMGNWISFHADPEDPGKLDWSVNEEVAAAYVRDDNATLGSDRYVNQGEALTALLDTFKARRSQVRLRIYHHAQIHTVKQGETLVSIASDYGMPYPWLFAVNSDLGDTLRIGQQVTIPSPDALLPLTPVENKRVKISISNQRMQAYENGQVKWDWPVSTGIPSSPTSPGVFQVQSHDPNAYAGIWNLWMPWFMGIYRPVPSQDFMNGFHGFPSRDQRQLLWTRNLGRPVTYGCILLSTDNAKLLYDWAPEGMIVEITK
jgi:lipoprotein-anchoring transpeptidase ErfK/SrfK